MAEKREVLPGFVGPFEATRLNEGVWRVRDDAGEILVDDVGQATATTLAAILNSHGALVEALKGWDGLYRRMVAAGGDEGPMSDEMVQSFARTQADLIVATRAALSLPQ